MSSIKKNIILNGINTATSILFPVITFPYAARVLLPEGIGAVNFLNSIVGYIILLTSLGLPMYAVKEVARYRDDKAMRDKTTLEIIILSTILCLIGYVAVWLLATFVPQIHQNASLFYILSLSIIFTSLGVNWFYQAIEDFKFITMRAVIVRTLSAAALFIFVHGPSDLLIYGVINVGATVGNNLINFLHLRKHLTRLAFSLKDLQIRRHVRPAIEVFIFNLIVSLYVQLNSVMLGFMAGDDAVGYFTAGTKISHMALMIVSSIGTVLLPRCSNLLQQGDIEGFGVIIRKSIRLVLGLSLPLAAGMMVLAAPITMIFCGAEFEPAVPVLLLNAPVIVFISITGIMGVQVLYPLDHIKIVTNSVTAGAVINLVLNFLMIPLWGATGAAIATFLAELAVLIVMSCIGHNYFPFKLRALLQWQYYAGVAVMSLAVFLSAFCLSADWMKLVVGIPVGIVAYYIFLLACKDPLLEQMHGFFLKKLLRSSN